MDPDTGAVLAMASSPDYDLNDPSTVIDSVLQQNLAELQEDESVSEEEYAAALSQAQFSSGATSV